MPRVLAPPPACSPAWRFALLAVALRLALLGLRALVQPWDWVNFLGVSDAGSFLHVARCLAGLAEPSSLSFYDTRVLAGWPLLLAAGLRFFPEPLWLIGLTSAASGAAVWCFHRLSRDDRLTLLFCCAPPVWLLVGAQGMAEPAYLAAGCAALLCACSGRWWLAGLLGGAACAFKPHGIFLAGGLALAAVLSARETRWRNLLWLTVGGLVAPVLVASSNHALYGDVLRPFRTYGADLVLLNIPPEIAERLSDANGAWAPPFFALIETPLKVPVPVWKLVYIYTHVLALVFLLIRSALRRSAPDHLKAVDPALRCWLIGVGGAILCAGPYWGFQTFDRYFIWMLPAALLLQADMLRQLPRWTVALTALSSCALAAGLFALRS